MSVDKIKKVVSGSNLKANGFAPVLVVLLIVAAFFLGSLWSEVKYLKAGAGQPVLGANNGNDVPTQQAPQDNGAPVKVSVDDDPILGDKKARVTLIEFSDYECPFCKKYFTDTYPQIKKDYIDSGKVKLVFRDLPLGFHQSRYKDKGIFMVIAQQFF